jgi:hypothetical protein
MTPSKKQCRKVGNMMKWCIVNIIEVTSWKQGSIFLLGRGCYQIKATWRIWYGRSAPAKVRSYASMSGVIEFPSW